MTNNEFWKEYNKKTITKLNELINRLKQVGQDYVLADLHMHTTYSSDAKQTLLETLENTKKLGFDVISFTDHDDVRVYDEIRSLMESGFRFDDYPIIITGIEHTTSYPLYGEMCHILKHFIIPTDKSLLKDVKIVERSYFKRAKIQIKRIYENPVLNKVIKTHRLNISYRGFLQYLKEKNITIPDYAPLIDYLADELKRKNISTGKLYEDLKENNATDPCEERRLAKEKRFKVLDEKYKDKDVQDNRRFLLSILAVRGVDDFKYNGYKSYGSLSVNEYGQVSVFKLNKVGITSFAHPTESSIEAVLKAPQIGGGIISLENNIKNPYKNEETLQNAIKQMGLFEIRGSDCHHFSETVYDDLAFYKINLQDFEKFVNLGEIANEKY